MSNAQTQVQANKTYWVAQQRALDYPEKTALSNHFKAIGVVWVVLELWYKRASAFMLGHPCSLNALQVSCPKNMDVKFPSNLMVPVVFMGTDLACRVHAKPVITPSGSTNIYLASNVP